MRRFLIGIFFLTLATNSGLSNAQPPDAAKAPAASVQPKHDLSTPEAAVRSFAAALSLYDVNRALSCVYKANTRKRTLLVEHMQLYEKTKASYSIIDVDIKGEIRPHRALASVKWKYTRVDAPNAAPIGFEEDEFLLLFQAGQDWKILSGDPNAIWTPAQGGSLQMIATEIAHPEVYEAEVRCPSRVEDMAGRMMSLFSRKYNGKLAVKQKAQEFKADTPAAEKWSLLKRALVPEFNENLGPSATRIFHCPADGDDYEKESYSFNERLDGLAVAAIAEPANTVLIYEGKDGQLNFQHDGRASVAFVDGHVELINAEQSKTLRWAP